MPTKVKKVQVNVDRTTADNAEEIMKEIGVTPSVVVNTLYKEIEATGKIPLSFSLTPRQRAEMELDRATKGLPVKHLRTQKELEDFFDED
jgi:DNA-damage-inducible protein J